MYRNNYRYLVGIFNGMKMYYNGSFLSQGRYAKGDIIFCDAVCGEVEIHQSVVTGAQS